jgi:hypothetical protein
LPHVIALAACIFLAIGIALLGSAIQASRPPRPPVADKAGWFRIAEERTIGGKFRIWAVVSLLWYAYCFGVLAEYFTVKGRRLDLFCGITLVVCGGLGLIPLMIGWRYWRLHHDFLDAELSISQDQIHPGDAIKVRLCQRLLRPLEIEELSIGAICIRNDQTRSGNKTQYTSQEEWSSWKTIESNHAYASGAQMNGQTELEFPPGAHPSGASSAAKYPYFQWFLGLRVKTHGQPKLNVRFPIIISRGAGAS